MCLHAKVLTINSFAILNNFIKTNEQERMATEYTINAYNYSADNFNFIVYIGGGITIRGPDVISLAWKSQGFPKWNGTPGYAITSWTTTYGISVVSSKGDESSWSRQGSEISYELL